ncbi:MAG TPA: glycosyltransferase, partial [Planctomycetia bacterium]|nr:glycosyltransferase [Planctomycetia bacterium]
VERVVPRVARAKAGRDRAAARERLGIGPGEFLVGFGPESAGAGGAPARVRALRLSAAMLPAADVAVCMPFRDLRSEFALTALAYGIPIVGTRLLEHADLMHEGVTGIEIPEGDPAALCEALELLAENPDLLTRMGRQSRWWLASRAHPMTVREMWVELLWEAAEIGLARRPARENRAAGSFPGESAPRVES